MSWWSDILGVVEGTNAVASGQGATAPATVNNAMTGGGGLTGFFNAIETFATALTDGKMWRSLSWVTLGAFLIVTGLVLLMRKPIAELGGAVARGAMM